MNENNRTTKCGAITSEMTWQEILVEFRKIENDHEASMSLSMRERGLICGALFSENDHKIILTFPEGLTEREFKERLFFGRYGEHLPEDFFKNEEKLCSNEPSR